MGHVGGGEGRYSGGVLVCVIRCVKSGGNSWRGRGGKKERRISEGRGVRKRACGGKTKGCNPLEGKKNGGRGGGETEKRA